MHHPLQRLTLIYLATYLLIGGGSLLVVPDLALRLLLSNGAYGDIMPRKCRGFVSTVLRSPWTVTARALIRIWTTRLDAAD
jgi:hypothetical protein